MKEYVKITADFEIDGTIIPTKLHWNEDKIYSIDRILDIRKAASLKSGGCGLRYTVRIRGHERYLFLEEDKWFIEKRY